MFLTGTDEHGMKIAGSAASAGMKPLDLCTKYSDGFRALNQRLNISNDSYIRTTDDYHMKTAQELWKKCEHDIYLSEYEGYYLVREERYVTEREAKEWGYKDPASGVELQKSREESYFFKMSRYQDRLIEHIKSNPGFIVPEQYRTEILSRLESDPLEDLCVSRTSFDWGIPVPGNDKHVMYVWFDALTNYISGLRLLDTDGSQKLKSLWPAWAHIIGKDIVWFHTVIWPCMLMSANIELPKRVAVHGFILDAEGRKMSKSLGNVVDPHDLLDKYACDTVRWYMCSSQYGLDFKFSADQLEDYHRADLGNNLGNLVSRAVALSAGVVPDVPDYSSYEKPFDVAETVSKLDELFLSHQIGEAAQLIRQRTTDTNKWLADSAPWAVKDHAVKKATLIRIALEAVYVLAHFWAPFVPKAASVIFEKVGQSPKRLSDLRGDFCNLISGAPVSTSKSILFDPLRK
jgi:methionyl-tRNA synthetase